MAKKIQTAQNPTDSEHTAVIEELQSELTQDSNQTLVPATEFVSLTSSNSPRMSTVLQSMVKDAASKGADITQRINTFIMASAVMIPSLSEMVGKSKLPKVNTEDFDTRLKGIDESITEQGKLADEASKTLDEQIKALNEQRNLLRKPFSDKIEEIGKVRSELVVQREQAAKPLVESLTNLREKAIELALNSYSFSGDNPKNEATELIDALLTIKAPVHVTASAGPRITTGEGRGRGSASAVRITKGSESLEFKSLNAARAHIYQSIHGEQPKHQANADACTKYIANQGWALEHLS